MRGPIPKDPRLRQRRNRVATAAVLRELPRSERRRTPSLPKRSDGQAWHPLTKTWWRDIWRSPMAAEYLRADLHGLYRLAMLVDRFWLDPKPTLAAEIRLQQTCFGLTPLDRMRLRWEVERVEEATRKRQAPEQPATVQQAPDDPRNLLRLVA